LKLTKIYSKHFLSLAGNAIIALFGIATIALLSHFLSEDDVGEWFVFLGIISICDAVRNGFLNTATIKFYGGIEPEKAAEVLGSVWYLSFAITLAILALNGLAFFTRPYFHSRESDLLLKWVGLTFLSSLPYSVMFWKLQADENYAAMIWLRLLNNGSTILVFIILIILKQLSLSTAMLYNFETNCLTSIVGIIWGQARLRTIFKRSKQSIAEIAQFGKYSLATTLSSTMLRTSDTFILRSMISPAAVAIYTLPGRLLETVELPLRSLAATGMSSMAVAFNKKDIKTVSDVFKKYSGLLTMSIIPQTIFVFLFSEHIINMLYGNKYAGTPAANIYRIFMVMCLIYPIDRFNGITLDIIHKPQLNFYKVLFMLGVNIVADIAGIMIFKSVYSVVLAGFITNVAALMFGYYNLRKYVSYSIPDILRNGYIEAKTLVVKFFKIKT